MNRDPLAEFQTGYRERVQAALEHWLPEGDLHPARLHQAMRYAVLDGGKRVRPLLVYAAGLAVGAEEAALDAPAVAVECIHAYSLVHDDLPAMDDDDLRRGQPSCHRAFDEAHAILAGDALQSLAFHVLAEGTAGLPAEVRLRMVDALAQAAGSRGMAGGQAIDLESEGKTLDLAQIEDLHIHKTGALIRASVLLGALCGPETDETSLERLDHYAKCVGLAFQIRDDILDVEGDTDTLGKTAGSDHAAGKATYPAVLGLEEAKEHCRELVEDALNSLRPFDLAADPLRWLASYIIDRDR